MKLRNQSFGCRVRGKTLASSVAVLATCGALSGVAFGQTAPTAITYGQAVQGALGDATDTVLQDGRPIDRYVLITQAAGQPYAIRARSPEIAIASTVLYFDSALGQYVPLQRATTFVAGQQVLYAGVLEQPGRYLIDVFPQDLQAPVGSYTLNLTCLGDDLDDDGVDDDDFDEDGFDDDDDNGDGIDDDDLDGDGIDDDGLDDCAETIGIPGGGVGAPGGGLGDDDNDGLDDDDDDDDDGFDG